MGTTIACTVYSLLHIEYLFDSMYRVKYHAYSQIVSNFLFDWMLVGRLLLFFRGSSCVCVVIYIYFFLIFWHLAICFGVSVCILDANLSQFEIFSLWSRTHTHTHFGTVSGAWDSIEPKMNGQNCNATRQWFANGHFRVSSSQACHTQERLLYTNNHDNDDGRQQQKCLEKKRNIKNI